MGMQRSGTSTLFHSFAKDPMLISFDETSDIAFSNYLLKPEIEIRPVLLQTPHTILLKSISETKYRSVKDVFKEYRDYDLHVIWIYRDPVNVFYSHVKKWGVWSLDLKRKDENKFIKTWNSRNESVLDALPKYRSSIAVIKYEDLAKDSRYFWCLSNIMKLKGKYLFRTDSCNGRRHLSQEVMDKIDTGTLSVLSQLDQKRILVEPSTQIGILLGILNVFSRRTSF